MYYALLRGFLEDQYTEKYAVLTWLIPTTPNPMTFDPSLFVLGESELYWYVRGERGEGGGRRRKRVREEQRENCTCIR